jgi:WD40 repeat protein
VLSFDRAGTAVASGSRDGSLRIWDTASGAPRPFFSSHVDGAVHDVVFSPDGRQLASASRGSVMVIDARSGELLAQTGIQSSQPRLSMGPDGGVIYIAGDRDGLTRWVWRGGVTEPLPVPGAGVTRVALSPDGRFLVTADGARQLRLVDISSGKPMGSRRRLPAAVVNLWFSAKGDRLIAQAGLWIHSFSTAAGELDYLATRRLQRAPVALQPAGNEAIVLTITGASRPSLATINLFAPSIDGVQQISPPAMPDLEARFRLTLTDWGEPQALN